MTDPSVAKLADLIVNYSVQPQPGELVRLDDGARVLGEVAFGLNYEIDRFTRDILFDEKIGGTLHFAFGSSFKRLGGRNDSGLHWDLICDLCEEGEVYADGELVWNAGRFLREPAPVEAAVAG
jgi:aminopeptidase